MLLIISEPRVGSTLLTDLFGRNTEFVGRGEPFYEDYLGPAFQSWEPEDLSACEAIVRDSFTATGRFRVGWAVLPRLRRVLAHMTDSPSLSFADNLQMVSPGSKCVRIVRADKIRQAVSSMRMIQSQASLPQVLDQPFLRHEVVKFIVNDARVSLFLDEERMSVPTVLYEEFVRDIPSNFIRLCEDIDIRCPDATDIEIGETRLFDEQSRAWVHQFLAEGTWGIGGI